jgi:glycosyltransferase involved in cell wall biosynthesis
MFRRDVDYCSGAFLMTRRALWEKLNGFDETYAPAYYEDADYCLRAREEGFRTVYDPMCVVDHFENGSESKPGNAAAATLANRKCFRARHWRALKRQLPFSLDNILAARESSVSERRRLLVLDNEVPLTIRGSGYPRMRQLLIEAVGAGCSVCFFPLHELEISWRMTRAEVPWEIEVMSGLGAPKLANFLEQRRGYYDAILVSRPDNMALVRNILEEKLDLLGGARLIYDAEALFAERRITLAAFEGCPMSNADSEKIISEEIRLARGADAIICVSDMEASSFRARQTAPVYVLGHSIQSRDKTPTFEERAGFLFVGRLLEREAPNWRGLQWFLEKVWPIIQEQIPQATVVVAGPLHQSADDLRRPGVQLLGEISDLTSVYDQARVFVAPTKFAAGIPIKILEATAAGLPSVATTLLARQLSWASGIEIVAEDQIDAFADAAVKLHEDRNLWAAIRNGAQRRLDREYSAQEFRKSLELILDLKTPFSAGSGSFAGSCG